MDRTPLSIKGTLWGAAPVVASFAVASPVRLHHRALLLARPSPPLDRDRLFDFARLVGTPGALDALERAGVSATLLLYRHAQGDWGDPGGKDHDAKTSLPRLAIRS